MRGTVMGENTHSHTARNAFSVAAMLRLLPFFLIGDALNRYRRPGARDGLWLLLLIGIPDRYSGRLTTIFGVCGATTTSPIARSG